MTLGELGAVNGRDPETKSRDKQLADQHWEWLGELLRLYSKDNPEMKVFEYLYKTAATHFYKHGWEDCEKLIQGEKGK